MDSVHQGDLDGIKGLYLISLVDETTQMQCVCAVEKISDNDAARHLNESRARLFQTINKARSTAA